MLKSTNVKLELTNTVSPWTHANEMPIITQDIRLDANWVKASKTLTVNPDGGVYQGSPGKTYVRKDYGEVSTVTHPSRDGYIFEGWDINGVEGLTVDAKQVSRFNHLSNTEIIARWKLAPNLLVLNNNIEFALGATGSGTLDRLEITTGPFVIAGLRIHEKTFEKNSEYELSFSYQKIGGTLVSFGGHTGIAFPNNKHTYLNGELVRGELHDENSIYTGDNNQEHFARFRFSSEDMPDINDNNGTIWIQPNRGHAISATVILRNIKLQKVR